MFKCTTLENEVEIMRAEILAKEGVVFGTHRFASEDALMWLIMKLHPKGGGLAAFSDAFSLFCRDEELSTSTDPHKMLSMVGWESQAPSIETTLYYSTSDTPQSTQEP